MLWFIDETAKTVDGGSETDYNNNRGDNNGLSDQRTIMGGNQKSSEIYSGRETEGNRTREESQESFTERTQRNLREVGQGKRLLLRHGNAVMSYVPKTADNTPAGNSVKMLEKAGIEAVLCDGTIESNENGKTTVHNEAITTPDGKVYVSSNTQKSDSEIVAHESVHSNMYRQTKAYEDYEAVVCDNIIYGNDSQRNVFAQINDNHYLTQKKGKSSFFCYS